jgi:hypothetical protein
MSADNWYIARDNKTYGPYTTAQMKQMAESRQLLPSDMILQDGSTQWKPASLVQEFVTVEERHGPLMDQLEKLLLADSQFAEQYPHPNDNVQHQWASVLAEARAILSQLPSEWPGDPEYKLLYLKYLDAYTVAYNRFMKARQGKPTMGIMGKMVRIVETMTGRKLCAACGEEIKSWASICPYCRTPCEDD